MSIFEKLDELITKLDEPQEEIETSDNNGVALSNIENNSQDDIILDGDNSSEEVLEQNESSEDAANSETFEKLVTLAEKQQEQIINLKAQLASLVKQGANVHDGKDAPIAYEPEKVPQDYTPLKELDFNM